MLSFQRMKRFSFLFPLLWLSPYDGLSWLQTWLHWEKQASVCVAEGISRCDWVRGPLNWRINNRKWKAVVEGYLKEVGNREVAWKNPLLSSPPCLTLPVFWLAWGEQYFPTMPSLSLLRMRVTKAAKHALRPLKSGVQIPPPLSGFFQVFVTPIKAVQPLAEEGRHCQWLSFNYQIRI